MTSPVLYVTPQHTLDECLAIMTKHRIRHLESWKADKWEVSFSIGDLVKFIISEQEDTIELLEPTSLGTTRHETPL